MEAWRKAQAIEHVLENEAHKGKRRGFARLAIALAFATRACEGDAGDVAQCRRAQRFAGDETFPVM